MDPAPFLRLLHSLDHRGADGRDARQWVGAALGHQHFWTTPEEVGEIQPLCDSDQQMGLAFEGRLDNREELSTALGLEPAESRALSDAALAFRAYREWGTSCIERFLGPFVLAVVDHRRREVFCARDPLGDRTLYYVLRDRWLAVASEESALLTLPGVPSTLDQRTVARFFAVEAPAAGATFFAEVRELPPAHAMLVTPTEHRMWRYWRLDEPEPLSYRHPEEYQEHFRSVLGEAVRCRLRSRLPPAVLMSGGLDSTSVAAFAAERLGPGLRAITWTFDELPGADERTYTEAMVERFQLQRVWVNGDGAWPLRDLPTWPVNPNTPITGLYARLAQATYAAASAAGSQVILSGEFGDQLYEGGEYWLADLLRSGRLLAAGTGLVRYFAYHVLARRAAPFRMRRVIGRALGKDARLLLPASRPWLTEEARALVSEADGAEAETSTRRPIPARLLFDALWCRGNAVELRQVEAAGADLRRPYRDLRVMQLALSLPGHQLFWPGWTKAIVRQSMHRRLPEVVRWRRERTSLVSLGKRGLVGRESATVRALIRRDDGGWRRFVRPEWMEELLANWPESRAPGRGALVPWWAVCFQLWKDRCGLQ